MPSTLDMVVKRFDADGETRTFPTGRFEVVRIGGLTVGRATYQPGWRWSAHVGPAVNASRCTVEHVGLVLSGAATAAFDDGRIVRLTAGDFFYIPPVPHDSWVLGEEPYVSLHFLGAGEYASTKRRPVPHDCDALCFVCGHANPLGLGAVFERDPKGGSRATYLTRREHDGWPGMLHGGVLFALLDDAVGWAARYSGCESVTGRAEIRYRRPVPTHTTLTIAGQVRTRGRVLTATAEAVSQDSEEIVATLDATLVPRRRP
jgi:acyl-coenzyme A thioesterase PaaI-like protein/mannose-6-phosphate isomerase-like protein (cupin superfamily)